jgi:hypothetical protein
MNNRIIAIVTLESFLSFSWSCYSVQEIKPEVLASAKPGDYEIRKIEKTTGETVEYSADAPGDVGQGRITGTGKLLYAAETVEVDSAGLGIVSKPDAPFIEVKTRDGRTYGWIKNIDERGNKSVLHILKAGGRELFSTPIFFSEIHKAWALKFDIVRTLIPFLVLGIFSLMQVLIFSNWTFGGL